MEWRGILGPRGRIDPDPEEANRIADLIITYVKEHDMSNPTLRCKMKVESVLHRKNNKGETESEEITLRAVSSDTEENKTWSKWTPSGELRITISNPSAIGKVLNGHEYFVDFTPVGTR